MKRNVNWFESIRRKRRSSRTTVPGTKAGRRGWWLYFERQIIKLPDNDHYEQQHGDKARFGPELQIDVMPIASTSSLRYFFEAALKFPMPTPSTGLCSISPQAAVEYLIRSILEPSFDLKYRNKPLLEPVVRDILSRPRGRNRDKENTQYEAFCTVLPGKEKSAIITVINQLSRE